MLLTDFLGRPMPPGRLHLKRHWNAADPLPAWLTRRTTDTDAASTAGAMLTELTAGVEQYPCYQFASGAPVGSTATVIAPQVDVTHPALLGMRMHAVFNAGAAGNRRFEMGWRTHLDGTTPTAGYDIVCDAADASGDYYARQRAWTAEGEASALTNFSLAWTSPTTINDATLWWFPQSGWTDFGTGEALDSEWASPAARGVVTPYIRTTATQAGGKAVGICCVELDYWFA